MPTHSAVLVNLQFELTNLQVTHYFCNSSCDPPHIHMTLSIFVHFQIRALTRSTFMSPTDIFCDKIKDARTRSSRKCHQTPLQWFMHICIVTSLMPSLHHHIQYLTNWTISNLLHKQSDFFINDSINVCCDLVFLNSSTLTFSCRSTRICALKGMVEVAKVHIFVQLGI
jgi:hypothetical protein